MTYLFAALCAVANAIFSVLQRKANRDQPGGDNLSPRLVVDLLRNPAWFLGSCGVIGGFLLQAAALSGGALALVEPIRIFELSATLRSPGSCSMGHSAASGSRRQRWRSGSAACCTSCPRPPLTAATCPRCAGRPESSSTSR